MKVNTKLSVRGCLEMVNRIQNGRTPQEIRERCGIAEEWLRANKIITTSQYNDMMMAVSCICRESYHLD